MLSTLPSIDALHDGDTLLYHASHQGNLTLIRELISHQADINAQGFSGPALHESILQGHDSITSYLLQEGADINLRSLNVLQEGFSPLHTAILCSNSFATKLLLEMNASLLAEDAELNTPLHIAVKEENCDLAALLLSSGASMTAINSNQETPFCLAVDCGNLELVELFINKGVFKLAPSLLNDSLIRAINTGNVSVVQLMLLNGADVNFVSFYKRYTPLHHAVVSNSLPVVEILLQNGADASARTETNSLAIFFAAHRKNESILDLLLEKHATVGPEGAKLLYEAVMEDCELLIKKILSSESCDVNVDGFAPDLISVRLLEAAIVHNKHDSVRGLIFSGADVELTDSRGVTFWDLALERRNFDFFHTWLNHGGGFYHSRSRRALYLSRLEKMIHVTETERPGGWKIDWELRDHLIKMKCCGFFTHSRYDELTDIYGTREREYIAHECAQELQKIKTQVLEGVSGWELLQMDDRRLGIWSRKVKIDGIAKFEKFWLVKNWLYDCYRRGARRRRLIKVLRECFWEILKIEFDCLGGIVDFLDNDDIRNLIFACNGQGQ